MTQTEVYSHFLNVCNKEVVPLFTFPTPLDDPKFHDGQKCVTVVANVILGGYDDFPFGIPGAWNSNGNEISYESSYGMCWFLFLDWNSSNKIVPLEYSNATIEVCPSCNISIIKVEAWNVVVIPRTMMPLKTVGRNSRLFKMLLHRAFTTAEILVYMDGNFHLNRHREQVFKDSFGRNSSQIERQFMKFVNKSMSPGPNGAQPAWASPKHPQRCTPYQEGLTTCVMGLSGDSGVQQMHHYYADGFPTIPSYYPYLIEGCWHIRDLKRVESSLMGCAWMAEYLRWDQPRDQLSFNYAIWKLSKCINMREEDFLRVGVQLANVVARTINPYHGAKRETYSTEKCGQVKNYSNQCGKDPQCKPCKLLPVPAAETALPLPTPALCPEKKTEMTQTEVYSHFLNVCNKEVVPLFTFPTPLDDPKFHDGQKCVTVVANVILGGYDDFPFGIPGAWNSNGNEISYESSYGMCWFLFLDWNSSNKIVPLEYSNATIEVCPSCNISIIKVEAWNVVVIPRTMMPLKTVGRNSRLFKMLLHRAFTTAEILVYMDGNFHLNRHREQVFKDSFGRNSSQIERQFMKFVNKSMSPGPNGAQPAWASPKHPQRCTPYQEGLTTCVMDLSGDSGVQQMHHYYADGFPTIPSYYPYLIEGCWHIRDLKRVESSLMGCAWMAEYLRWDQPRDQLSFNYAIWKLSKCINMREEDFLRVGVQLANVVARTINPYHGAKRETYSTEKCGQVKNYSNQCGKDPQCKPCKLLPVPAAETALPLPTPALCPEKKTEMTQTEVYSHFLNVCNKEVVPLFTFPTPLDDPKFHDGQKCVTVVANVILGGYDDFPFGIPGAWNSNGNEISYESSYGMCWFLFLDWNSSNKIVPLEYSNATIEVCPSCNISIIKVEAWNVVVIPRTMMPLKTVGRNSRLFKMLLHRAFTTAEILVYMDGNFHLNRHREQVFKDSFGRNSSQIERQFMKFVNKSMSPGPNGAQPAWASPKHPQRCTPYQEGLTTCVMDLSGDSGVQQMHHYYADGFPTIPSYYPYLIEGCWHIRDLKRVESSLMGCAWMAEYLRWDQPRDQLSFNYAIWKLSKCINMREEDFLRVGVQLANVVTRTINPYHGTKRETYGKKRCPEIKNYTDKCNQIRKCRQCKAAA